MADPKQHVEREIVRILRAARQTTGERRTILLRDLAEQMVDLREHYQVPSGDPDWTGRTGVYRYAVRELYAQAGYSPEERKLTQTSTRYHVGNLVRARVPQETADALGLERTTPQDRNRMRTRRDRDELRELLAEARELLAAHKKTTGGAQGISSSAR
ncbi:hypothetical protein JOD64_003292 [Micromonospora luteifusca]|uniref:Uncharacterized protein n=1 Tax=Micromonospora luteifusca TaxID=709860 RepID=A0ABS2LVA9_9ACTN|nr:hypothetical protein [Micromonospora luteifusca]MBM7492070.1 hypothetical protein [Micromonospora luteifusca]